MTLSRLFLLPYSHQGWKRFYWPVMVIIFWLSSFGVVQAQDGQLVSLDGTWAFKTDLYRLGEQEEWFAPETDTEDWSDMQVPGVWDTENEFADFAGTAWYRRSFTAGPEWEGKWARLVFQAVYNDVKVWLNGEYLGDHHVGFLPFQFNINKHLRAGQENTLVLAVDNIFKRGAIWNWGGIRRPVWIEITDPVRIENQHIRAVPNLENGTASIEVDFEASNFGNAPAEVGYELEVFRDGIQVYSQSEGGAFTLSSGESGSHSVSFTLPADKVDLWHFNYPNLYESRLVLLKGGQAAHQLSDKFGIRKIEVDGLELKLNGESVRTVGFNIVAEDRTTGNTLPLWRIKEDVDLLKQLGVNMARLNHLPLPAEFLDYLDEKGIMVFEEVSLWGKDVMVDPEHPLPKYWLEKMISTKFNHPSIIGWSVGNEIGYLNSNPKAMEYVEGAIKHAKSLDPNRLAVYVTHSASSQEVDPVQYSDLIMLNKYGNWGQQAEAAHKLHPGKPIFYSEFGKELNTEDLDLSEVDIKEMLDQMRGKPYLMGGSHWTFNDYRSFWQASPTWTTPPSQNRTWGIVNVFRQKKASYYDFKREYAPVRELKVDVLNGQTLVKITPRDKLDIPSYPLQGYVLLWTLRDDAHKLLDGGSLVLPELLPNDKTWETALQAVPNGANLKVEILDPQSYSVLDTTLYGAEPPPPRILSIHTANTSARVVFDPVQGAEKYFLRYGSGNMDSTAEATFNHYFELTGLEYGKEYNFSLIAVNGAGESEVGKVHRARTDEDELPPIIWTEIPGDRSFFVGYSVGRTDYVYEIKYGTRPGEYDHLISLRNVGVAKVPNLQNGQTYYYRMRRRMQWGFASEWSDERMVTPDGGELPAPPSSLDVILDGGSAIVLFDPVKKAEGYLLSVSEEGVAEPKLIEITSARSGVFRLENTVIVEGSRFTIQTRNAKGLSEERKGVVVGQK